MTVNDLFNKCVEWKLTKDGLFQCYCKLGFWSVEGRYKLTVAHEARHYWAQYYQDGDYTNLLKDV